VNEGQEVACGFFVSSGDSTTVFEPIDQTLDAVAFFVKCSVIIAWLGSVGTRRDHGDTSLAFHGLDELVAVISFVGNDVFSRLIRDQGGSTSDIVDGTAGQVDPCR